MNIAAWIAAAQAGFFAILRMLDPAPGMFRRGLINAGIAAAFAALPLLHRFSPLAAPLVFLAFAYAIIFRCCLPDRHRWRRLHVLFDRDGAHRAADRHRACRARCPRRRDCGRPDHPPAPCRALQHRAGLARITVLGQFRHQRGHQHGAAIHRDVLCIPASRARRGDGGARVPALGAAAGQHSPPEGRRAPEGPARDDDRRRLSGCVHPVHRYGRLHRARQRYDSGGVGGVSQRRLHAPRRPGRTPRARKDQDHGRCLYGGQRGAGAAIRPCSAARRARARHSRCACGAH